MHGTPFWKSPVYSSVYGLVLSSASIPLSYCFSLICFLCSAANRILPIAAVGLAAGTAAVVAAPVVLGAVGFTAGGVAAGSIAASVQSAVYGGSAASGSVFALLQSAGAAGIGAAGNAAIGGITAGITGGFAALGNYVFVCFTYKSCSVCLRFWDTFY